MIGSPFTPRPFGLSLSKATPSVQEGKGFDKLSPNGGRLRLYQTLLSAPQVSRHVPQRALGRTSDQAAGPAIG